MIWKHLRAVLFHPAIVTGNHSRYVKVGHAKFPFSGDESGVVFVSVGCVTDLSRYIMT